MDVDVVIACLLPKILFLSGSNRSAKGNIGVLLPSVDSSTVAELLENFSWDKLARLIYAAAGPRRSPTLMSSPPPRSGGICWRNRPVVDWRSFCGAGTLGASAGCRSMGLGTVEED